MKFLRKIGAEIFSKGRGEIFLPEPDSLGYFPAYLNIPYEAVKKAIRANTSQAERDRAWEVVKASAQKMVPGFRKGDLTQEQKDHLLQALAIASPLERGRRPRFLGEKVPGQLTSFPGPTRSIIPIGSLSPEEWQRGFTMRKFALSKRKNHLLSYTLASSTVKLLSALRTSPERPFMAGARAIKSLRAPGRTMGARATRFVKQTQKLSGVKPTGGKWLPAKSEGLLGLAPHPRRPLGVITQPALKSVRKVHPEYRTPRTSHRKIIAHEVAHQTPAGRLERLRLQTKPSSELLKQDILRLGHGPLYKSGRRQVEKQMKRGGLWKTMRKAGYALPLMRRPGHPIDVDATRIPQGSFWSRIQKRLGRPKVNLTPKGMKAVGGTLLVAAILGKPALSAGLGWRRRKKELKGKKKELTSGQLALRTAVWKSPYPLGRTLAGNKKKYRLTRHGPMPGALTPRDPVTGMRPISVPSKTTTGAPTPTRQTSLAHLSGLKLGGLQRVGGTGMPKLIREETPWGLARGSFALETAIGYQAGLEEGIREKARKSQYRVKQLLHQLKLWLKAGPVPAATRGLISGAISHLQQEFGVLPSISVGGVPVRSPSFRKEFQGLSNIDLRSLKAKLGEREGSASEDLRKALAKAGSNVQVELALREA